MAYKAEATIAAELMKFAMNGALYRGSKPVMWSVVEKTALAEAEVEYHDYTSDTVWVKFPVKDVGRTAIPGRMPVIGRRSSVALRDGVCCHLDDDAVDDPRQSRDQLLAEDRLTALYRVTAAPPRAIGRSRGR